MMIQPRAGENMGDTREGGGVDGTSADVDNSSVQSIGSKVPGVSGEKPGAIILSAESGTTTAVETAMEAAPQNVFELNPRKVYSIVEVDRILPIVKRITQEYVEKVQVLMARFESAKGRHDHKLPQIEREINEAVQGWQSKLEKLGLKTKGLWIADFDSGDGYFCWKYPEEKVNFWHQYHDGFGGRVKIDREKLLKTVLTPAPAKEKAPDLNV
jgi:hypothetical protein